MCSDICIHDKDDGNPHAHIMPTMRPIEPDGKWGQKPRTVDDRKINTVDWNDRERAEDWRKAWAAYENGAFRIAVALTEENVGSRINTKLRYSRRETVCFAESEDLAEI